MANFNSFKMRTPKAYWEKGLNLFAIQERGTEDNPSKTDRLVFGRDMCTIMELKRGDNLTFGIEDNMLAVEKVENGQFKVTGKDQTLKGTRTARNQQAITMMVNYLEANNLPTYGRYIFQEKRGNDFLYLHEDLVRQRELEQEVPVIKTQRDDYEEENTPQITYDDLTEEERLVVDEYENENGELSFLNN